MRLQRPCQRHLILSLQLILPLLRSWYLNPVTDPVPVRSWYLIHVKDPVPGRSWTLQDAPGRSRTLLDASWTLLDAPVRSWTVL
jgi:hypothetical protein